MPDRHRPRRGSMAYSPRKRAKRHFGRVKSWPQTSESEIRLQGFAGWKAGMTHVLVRETNPNVEHRGQEVRKAVTVVEVPSMRVLAVRGYRMTPYGLQTAGEAWADPSGLDDDVKGIFPRLANRSRAERRMVIGRQPEKRGGRIAQPNRYAINVGEEDDPELLRADDGRRLRFNRREDAESSAKQNGGTVHIITEHDQEAHFAALNSSNLVEVRLIAATQPTRVKSIPTKVPEIMELCLTGGDIPSQLAWARERLGQEIGFEDVYQEGQDIDVIGVTKGKGFQGVIKRFGVKLLSHKNSKKRRQIGNMGDFGTGYVRKTIRQAGQMGYHQRTELNKRILKVGDPEEIGITPDGGFLHYGEVTNPYILVQGSLPGPAKRLLRFRDAVRPRGVDHPIDITYVSTSSKQGV